MDRRNFLSTLIGGVAATAAVRTWPFRVFSFPPIPTIPRHIILANQNRIDFIDLKYWDRSIRSQFEKQSAMYELIKTRECVPVSYRNIRLPLQIVYNA